MVRFHIFSSLGRGKINTLMSGNLRHPVASQESDDDHSEGTAFSVSGSLDKKGGRRCNLLLNKRWNLLPPFLSYESDTRLCLLNKSQIYLGENMDLFNSRIQHTDRLRSVM
jgi:hypothetical protein